MARRPGSTSRSGPRVDRPGRLDPGVVTAPRRPKPAPEAPAAADPNLVRMGEFGRAQGLNGEVRLKSYTADPSAIASYGPLLTGDGRRIRLTGVRPVSGDMLVARVEGVTDRTGAEALNRQTLFLPRERLGESVAEDEFFAADLIGLAVVDKEGTRLGTITDVPNYGGGDLLEIRPAAGGVTALLPFTKAFVPSLDIAAGRIVVDPPEDLFAPPGPKPADELD